MNGTDLLKILAAWLLLPLTALDWAIAWSRLPERLVTTSAHGRPIRWATRPEAMQSDLVVLLIVLAVSTIIAFLIAFTRPSRARHAPTAVMVSGGFCALVLNAVLWVSRVP